MTSLLLIMQCLVVNVVGMWKERPGIKKNLGDIKGSSFFWARWKGRGSLILNAYWRCQKYTNFSQDKTFRDSPKVITKWKRN